MTAGQTHARPLCAHRHRWLRPQAHACRIAGHSPQPQAGRQGLDAHLLAIQTWICAIVALRGRVKVFRKTQSNINVALTSRFRMLSATRPYYTVVSVGKDRQDYQSSRKWWGGDTGGTLWISPCYSEAAPCPPLHLQWRRLLLRKLLTRRAPVQPRPAQKPNSRGRIAAPNDAVSAAPSAASPGATDQKWSAAARHKMWSASRAELRRDVLNDVLKDATSPVQNAARNDVQNVALNAGPNRARRADPPAVRTAGQTG